MLGPVPSQSIERIGRGFLLGWILALAGLSVGARNFEPGLALDAPLYSTISRNIARRGNWLQLETDVPEFPEFAEHPHLGFWMGALVFKAVPIADWSARILGHLFYVAFLLLLFFRVRRLANEGVAALTVILLWSWYLFSNIFSTFYLEPGVLFFGAASVFAWESACRRRKPLLAALAGGLLGLALLYKGLTVLGFAPAWGWVLLGGGRSGGDKRGLFSRAALPAFISFALIVAAYVLLLDYGGAPHFLRLYWSRQVTHRFGQQWSLWGLVNREYWYQLLRYTYYLTPLAPIACFTRPGMRTSLPAVLAVSFIALFSTNGLRGGQYLVMVLPWVAWLIAETCDGVVAIPARAFARVTAVFAIGAVFLLQYFPVRTHSQAPGPLEDDIRKAVQRDQIQRLYVDTVIQPVPFFQTSRLAWYGDIKVAYADSASPPPSDGESLYFSRKPTAETESRLQAAHWCQRAAFPDGILWSGCASGHAVTR